MPQYRNAAKLLQGLDENLKATGLDYVDLWRITLSMEGVPDPLSELQRAEEATVEALAKAKQQGKARFTGVSLAQPRLAEIDGGGVPQAD